MNISISRDMDKELTQCLQRQESRSDPGTNNAASHGTAAHPTPTTGLSHLAVRVNELRHDAPVIFNVHHRQRRPTPVAPLVPLGVARHELLL